MDMKGVVEEVQGSEMALHHMEEEADHVGWAIMVLERSSLILMENMFTGMILICHQEKVIGYARTLAVEISTLLGEVTVTTVTSTAMSLAAVLRGVTLTLLPECHKGP